jgi:tRNA A-37 threonylcarbamoyl transferase component Bud32
MISNFEKNRNNGWTILIQNQFRSTNLISLICQEPSNAAGKEKVTSSEMAEVYRCTVEIEGKAVKLYVKEYLSRSTLDLIKHLLRPSRAMRAFKAGLMLEANGLHAPETAAVLEKRSGLVCRNILVTREMNNARALYTFFESPRASGDTGLRPMIKELGRTIGLMHAKGISHGDLRGGNLFVSNEASGLRFYFIDNERTTCHRHLPTRRRIKNLVQLNMLQYSIRSTDRMRFYKGYLETAGLDPAAGKILMQHVIKKTAARLKKRGQHHIGIPEVKPQDHSSYQRVRRENREGIFLNSFCNPASGKKLLESIDSLSSGGQVLKNDQATRVVRCEYNGHDIVIKRYNYQGLWHSLRHTLKGSRAKKSWRYGHRLMKADIPCAAPLGLIEERFLGIIRQSYIINDYIEGPLLYDVMNRPGYSPQEREAVMQKSRHLLEALGRNRFTHADMKPANLIIHKNQPVLIDLDSMDHHRLSFYFRYRYNKMVTYFHRRVHGKTKKYQDGKP